MIRIRPATMDDIPALLALERLFPSDRLSPRQMRYHIANKKALFLAAERDGKAVGYALFFVRQRAPVRFYSLIVDPAHRGQGIARRLIEAGADLLRGRGERSVGLEVNAQDKKTIALYEACGFVAGALVPAYYEDGRDALKMRKDLTR